MPFKENREDFNRKLLELMPGAVFLYDTAEGKFNYVSRKVKDVLGYELNEFLALPWLALTSEESGQRLKKAFESCVETRENEIIIHEFKHKDGNYHTIKTQVSVFESDKSPLLLMGVFEDITAAQQKQETYQKNQFLLAAAEKAMHFGSWDWDLERDEIHWSEGLFNIFGYTNVDERPQKMNYDFYLKHVHPSDKELALSVIEEVLIHKKPTAYERKIINQKGETRILRDKIQVVIDGNGKITRMVGTASDITRQKQAMEQLVFSEDLLAQTEKNFSYGSWNWNLESNEVYWSDGMIALFDYELSDFKSRIREAEFYQKHVHPNDIVAFKKQVDYFSDNRVEIMNFMEHRIITKKGNIKIVSTKGRIIKGNSNTSKVIGSTADITEQKKAFDKLAENEALLSETENILNYGSWSWHVPENKISWSDGLWSLLGYDPDKHRNQEIKNGFYTSHVHPEDQEQMTQNYAAFLEGKNPPNYSTERLISRDGQIKWVISRNRILAWDGDKPTKVIGSTADVTQMVLMQQDLEQKIRDLNRSNQDLEQFAYVASHDLQEPLRKITAFGERLQKKYAEALGEEGSMYITRMQDASFRMKALMESLLSFSRLTRKNEPLQAIDLNQTVQVVLADLEIKIQEKAASINIESKLPQLKGISPQMNQLFLNLLSNALKFSKKDIVPVINISSEKLSQKEKKEHNLRADQTFYKILVQDNGIGFEQEYAEKIFVIFQRLHGRSEYEGSGIGLAICRKIIDNHQGFITAQSELNQGTTFTLILPAQI
jgi:PAS domain S-box-containing protein